MDSIPPPKHRDKKSKKHKDGPLKRKRLSDSPEISKKARITTQPSSTTTSTTTTNAPTTPFRLVTTSLYLSLSPRYSYWPESTFSHLLTSPDPDAAARMRSFTPLNGIRKDHLDPLLMSYYEPLSGVIIAYNNIRFTTPTARISSESPFAHVWVDVDFLVWAPQRGSVLQGWVNLQSASHVGLLVENTWNVSIPKERIPQGWVWQEAREGFVPKKAGKMVDGEGEGGEEGGMEGVEYAQDQEQGGWVDENGVYVDGLLKFQVESINAMGHMFSMEGSLLNKEEIERAVLPGVPVEKEKKKKKEKEGRKHKKSKSTTA